MNDAFELKLWNLNQTKYIHVSIALIVNDIIHDIITFLVAHVHS